jgi:hypothetical protein
MSSLDALASTSNPTIIAITETWFNQNSNTHLHGYSSFLKSRNGHGGGVALYISDEVESFEVHNKTLESQTVEQIWCGIRVGDEKFLVGCFYRPPPKQAEEKETRNELELDLIRSIETAASEASSGHYDGLCVFGDFNFTRLAWNQDGTAHISGGLSPDRKFYDTLNEQYLHQLVHFPSFSNANGQRVNYLDLVISNSIDRVYNIEPGPPLSDDCVQYHVSITGSIGLSRPYQKRAFIRSSFNYKKADFHNLSKEFDRINWPDKFSNRNTNDCYDIFVTEYNRVCELWIPKRSEASLKVQPPWMTGSLSKLISKKKRLWILVQKTGAKVKSLVDDYKRTRNAIKKATKRSVIDYERSIINDKKNQKRLYSYVKSKQRTSKSINSIRDQAGDVFNTGQEISNILNLYFKSVYVEEDKNSPLPHFESRTTSRLSQVSLDVADISKRLSELDEHKAPGVDGVHSLILKKCHKELASPLATVFFRSLNAGCIPDK